MVNLNTDNILNTIKETSASNSALSQSMAREEMKFNAEQAELNRKWQEQMSNTAHQREVKDLIAAGLNPVLSAGGSGASTPAGSSASGAMGKVDESFSGALGSYLVSLINSATSLNQAQISADATLQAAAMSAAATTSAASISSEAQKYIAKNYPSSPYSFLASAIGGAGDIGKNIMDAFNVSYSPTGTNKNLNTGKSVKDVINNFIKKYSSSTTVKYGGRN